ncbi:MAG TPA: glycosyltransferase family 2 protein [Chitinispirillaceae bacterium]|nr:glycosyltransferase family 2 protein [Chitinispirillaceae bacterium]
MRLSIVIPVFNEEKTIETTIAKVLKAPVPPEISSKEIVVVNDGSKDGSAEILNRLQNDSIRIFHLEKNRGKGAALQHGFTNATGDIVLIQDADLEYDPNEYPKLLQPLIDGHADVVYGSRFLSTGPHRVLYFWHFVGNTALTLLSNMFTNHNLTDMETGYKVFKKSILDQITIEEKRFGFEPEITAKVAKLKGVRVYEVGISYFGRTYEEGKKIGWKDAFRAFICILKYNIRNNRKKQ